VDGCSRPRLCENDTVVYSERGTDYGVDR